MAVNGAYERQGRRVLVRSRIVVSEKGTAAGLLTVDLPFPVQPSHFYTFSGVAGNTSNVLYALASGSTMVIANHGESSVIVDGADPTITDSYVTD